MLDDDFRLNCRRNYRFGCFCDLHLAEFYKRIGEEIPREKLEEVLLTGGKNRYRTEMLVVFRDSLRNFIKALRSTIDTVNPDIRLGVCKGTMWDLSGTDILDIAKIACGKNKPFARISGAPYCDDNIIPIIEYAREQFAWGKGTGVELFAEGDTYPRPRHNVPSKTLELFDFILLADGTADGMLAYLEEYNCTYAYERGYVDRFIRNQPIRDGIREIFGGKKPVGVPVFTVYHKAEDWDLGETLQPRVPHMILSAQGSPSRCC